MPIEQPKHHHTHIYTYSVTAEQLTCIAITKCNKGHCKRSFRPSLPSFSCIYNKTFTIHKRKHPQHTCMQAKCCTKRKFNSRFNYKQIHRKLILEGKSFGRWSSMFVIGQCIGRSAIKQIFPSKQQLPLYRITSQLAAINTSCTCWPIQQQQQHTQKDNREV